MNPAVLLETAAHLIDDPGPVPSGVVCRCAALLTRQALEAHLSKVLESRAPGAQATPFRTQLLCLNELFSDPDLARRIAYTWSSLSAATHHYGYELPPTANQMRGWMETVRTFIGTPT